MRAGALLLLLVLLASPAAGAPRQAEGRVEATVGHLVEAVPLDAPPGLARWSAGRSNVQALWVFEAAPGTSVLLDGMPPVLRTAFDLTGESAGWRSHPGCAVPTYRGLLATRAGPIFYETCEGATEAYLAPTRDLREADLALLATLPVPGAQARAEAFEARVGGAVFVFTGAPDASSVAFQQGRLVPLGTSPAQVDLLVAGPREALRVRLHDVVLPAQR